MTPPRDKKAGPKSLDELRRHRLEARIEELGKLLECNEEAARTSSPLSCAVTSLAAAEKACIGGRLQAAWAVYHQAYQFWLASLDRDQLRLHTISLRHESQEKLHNWRKQAIVSILDNGDVAKDSTKVTRSKLLLSRRLMDEHYDNMYFKLEAVAIRVKGLPWVLGLMIGLVLGASALWQMENGKSILFDLRYTSLVLLTGALGALLSNTLSALEVTSRIPVMIGAMTRWFVFPLIGALSALAVVLVLELGLLPIKITPDTPLLGWALVGGFSDQLLKRVLGKVEQAAAK